SPLTLTSFPTRRSSDLFFRLDYNLMNDPELSFFEVVRNFENPTIVEVPEKKIHSDNIDSEVKSWLSALIDQVENFEPLQRSSTRSEEHTSELQSRFDLV